MTYNLADAKIVETEKPVSAVETVIDYIRSQIYKRKLRKGDRLPTEGELCDILNVGRGSVREAMKRLEAIGLLEIRRGDGTYISSMQEVAAFDSLLYKIILEDIDFDQILDYRIQLEISIMQLAIRNCTPEVLDELYANCRSFETYISNNREWEASVLHDIDLEFHGLLGKASGNQLLSDVYRASLELFSPYIMRNYEQGQVHESPQETVNNHKLLIQAIEERNPAKATYAVINATNLWNDWVKASK